MDAASRPTADAELFKPGGLSRAHMEDFETTHAAHRTRCAVPTDELLRRGSRIVDGRPIRVYTRQVWCVCYITRFISRKYICKFLRNNAYVRLMAAFFIIIFKAGFKVGVTLNWFHDVEKCV